MATWTGWRATPSAARTRNSLWPEAKSIVVLGMNYAPDHDPLASLDLHDRGTISVYAQGDDYHDVIRKKLKRARRLHRRRPMMPK